LFGLATGRRRDAAVKYQRLSGVTQRFSRKQPYNCISDHVRDRPRHAVAAGYSTFMVEILNDNARPEAGEVYGAMAMAWAKRVGKSPTPTERK
jgi:predicted N-formylglutamate amidohydrolase